MVFEEMYTKLINDHMQRRIGEGRGRLGRGGFYAEKLFLQQVWWPLFHSLDHLHPEYEVHDWNRKSQFIDFAYLPPSGVRFAIECDGYQSHVKDMDRERFSYALNRDNFLVGMGWRMLHFSFDDIQHHPEVCRMQLQLVLAPYLGGKKAIVPLLAAERDLLRFAWQLGRPLRPIDAVRHFQLNYRTVRRLLQSLSDKGLMEPVMTGRGVREYRATPVSGDQIW